MFPLMTASELAGLLRTDVRTLRRWRVAGVVPEPIEIGPRAVRWNPQVLDEWLGARQTAKEHRPRAVPRPKAIYASDDGQYRCRAHMATVVSQRWHALTPREVVELDAACDACAEEHAA